MDWDAVELDYRAGVKPLRLIGQQRGCSHAAIIKKARRNRWTRDLMPRIRARADDLVSKEGVTRPVTTATSSSVVAAVELNARIEADVRVAHRAEIARARALVKALTVELERIGSYEPQCGPLPASHLSLVTRARVLRTLVEALGRVIALERQAFGLDRGIDGDCLPTVVVRDYTGRA